MAPQKLPILKVPRVAFELIHKHLNLTEIIHLSQCSTACKNLLQSLEAFEKDTSLRVTVAVDGCKVAAESERRDKFEVPDNQIINKETDVITWVRKLKDFFQCPIGNGHIKIDGLNFETLFVENDLLLEIEDVIVESKRFSNSQVEFLLDKLITKKLDISGHIRNDFSYHKTQYPENVYFETATWVTVDNLVDMMKSSEHVLMARLRFTDKDWNKVIKSWLEADNSKMRYMSVYLARPRFPTDYNMEEVFEGIEKVQGTKKRRDASKYFNYHVHYEKGYDIRRADGTMATVFIDSSDWLELVIVTVWDVPNPNLE